MNRLAAAVIPLVIISTPGIAAEQRFMVTGFESLAAAGPHKIIVSTGKAQSVRAVGAREDLERLEIEVEDNELRIGEKSSKNWLNWKDTKPVTIHVTTQRLHAVRLAGSGDVAVDRMNGEDMILKVAGSGDLNVGIIKAGKLDVSIAGSGNMALTGTCNTAEIAVAGSGDIEAAGLKCQNLVGKISGSGNLTADAAKEADLKVMGSGNITITGKAKCETRTMGSGRIVCGGAS